MKPDREAARKTYVNMRANIKSLEQTVLKLLRHPLVTTEQILAAREQYMQVWRSYVETTQKLKDQWPMRSQWGRYDPWWDSL